MRLLTDDRRHYSWLLSQCYVTSTLAAELSQLSTCTLLNICYIPGIFGPVEGQGSRIVLADGRHVLRSEKTDILIEKGLVQIVRDLPKHKEFNYGLQFIEDANGAWPGLLDESDKNLDLTLPKCMNTPSEG